VLPKIGQIVSIRKRANDGLQRERKVPSKVVDIFTDIVTLEMPQQEKGRRGPRFEMSEELIIEYEENEVTYRFKTFILGLNQDKQPVIAVRKPKPSEIVEETNRLFLRVLAEQEIAVTCRNGPHFVAVTAEIGGDEVTFRTNADEPIEEEMTVSCWLLINYRNGSIDHIPFDGRIAQLKRLDDAQEVTARIIDIKEPELKKLVRYCYERQLDFRK